MSARTFSPMLTRRPAAPSSRPAPHRKPPQRAAGASAGVPRFLAGQGQAPALSQRGDRWETEATRAAESVARRPRPPHQPTTQTPSARRPARTRVMPSAPLPGHGSGQPLSPRLRLQLESALGADLSAVRVHVGTLAQQTTAQVQARAFAVGSHVYLGAGVSPDDAPALAHEAAHTLQQSAAQNAVPGRGPPVRAATPRLTPAPTGMIQRLEAPESAPREEGLLERGFWSVLEEFAPGWVVELLREIRDVGFLEFLKRRLVRALDGLFAGLQRRGGIAAQMGALFQRLLERARGIMAALATGQCEPLFAAVRELRDLLGQMAGDAWNAITDFFRPVGDYLSGLWQRFGAPVVEFLQGTASEVWDYLSGLGQRLWDFTGPARRWFSGAWSRIKELIGMGGGSDDDGGGGLTGWISQQASRAWTEVQRVIEPVAAPIRRVAEQVQEFLPLSAITNLRDTATEWMDRATQMADTMEQTEEVAANQDLLRDVILPGVKRAIAAVGQRLNAAAAWTTGAIGGLVTRVTGFFGSLEANPLLAPLGGAIRWLSEEATQLGDWAAQQVGGLFALAGRALATIDRWIEPIVRALQRLVTALGNLMERLGDFVLGPLLLIPRCIRDPIKNFLVEQILSRIPIFSQLVAIPDLWTRAQAVFRRIVVQLFRDGSLLGAAWTFFREVLGLVGLPAQLVTNLIRNAARAIRDILRDPVGFLINLLRAVRDGFLQFMENIGTHLLNGIANWLFGTLGEAGIRVPREFSLQAVFDVVLQVLDLTQARVFAAIERRIGPERTAQIRRGLGIAAEVFGLVRILVEQGPAGLWAELRTRLSNLWEMVVNGVRDFLIGRVIAFATRWLMSLLDITGIMPVINSLIAIYNAIQSFIRYLRQMLEILNSVFEGLGEIARGVLTRAANLVEANLARVLPIAIGFLANQVGLGDLPNHIRRVIQGIRERVDRALDWIVDRVVRGVTAVVGAVRSAVAAVRDWWRRRVAFTGRDGQNHSVYLERAGTRYELTVASTPERVGPKARAVLDDPAASASDKTKARQILDAETRARGHSDFIAAETEAGRGSAAAATARAVQLDAEMQNIATLFVDLFSTGAAAALPQPVYSYSMNAGRAHTAEVRYLSANRPAGSAPSASPAGWSELQAQGLTTSGQRFVQMHLINERLGGLGVANNLVPGSTANNRDHHNSVENNIKNLVGHNPRAAAAITARKVVYYKLTVTYRTDTSDAAYNPAGKALASVGGRPAPSPTFFAGQINCEWGEYRENTSAGPEADTATRWGTAPASTVNIPIPIELPRLALVP